MQYFTVTVAVRASEESTACLATGPNAELWSVARSLKRSSRSPTGCRLQTVHYVQRTPRGAQTVVFHHYLFVLLLSLLLVTVCYRTVGRLAHYSVHLYSAVIQIYE